MRQLICGLAIVILYAVGSRVPAAEPLEDQEPPIIMHLEAAGKRIPVEFDKPFPLDGLAGLKTAVLRVEPYRVFSQAGLSFQYPREYI